MTEVCKRAMADTRSYSDRKTPERWWWLEASDADGALNRDLDHDVTGNQAENGENTSRTRSKAQVFMTGDASAQEIVTQWNLEEKRELDGDAAMDARASITAEKKKTRHCARIWESNQSSRSSREEDDAANNESSSSSASSSLVSSFSTLGDCSVLPETDSEGGRAGGSGSEIQSCGGVALDADMLALWKGSASVSAGSDSSFSGDGDGDDGDISESCGGGSVSDLQISESSASAEDLESSIADSFPSSLSSFSTQSGVCKLSDPRLIENIPSVSMAVCGQWDHNFEDYTDGYGYPQCRTYSKDDFVQPDNVAPSALAQEKHKRSARRSLKRGDEFATHRLLARLQPPLVHLHPPVAQPQFVSEDPELFVKFSGLQGILLEHVPRRRDFFLDLGCGTSTVCKEMVLHGYNHVFGVDVAASKLQRQRDQCKELERFVRFLEMDAAELRFPDAFFDCVFTKAVLDMVAANYVYTPMIDDNFDELQRILREISRCLQPGGVWVMVSCHSSTRSACALKSAFDVEERVSTPWWEWDGISEYIHSQFDRVKSYSVGTPILEHGMRVKPFMTIVFRRKQTKYQQLKRLRRIQQEEQRDEKEFELMNDWLVEKRRWQVEQGVIVRETRAMVQEDAVSRFRESNESYTGAMRAREAVRDTIYTALLEHDRVHMKIEDAVATAARAECRAVVAFVRSVLLAIGDTAVCAALVVQAERSKLIELDKLASTKTVDAEPSTTEIAQTSDPVACSAPRAPDAIAFTRDGTIDDTQAAQVSSADTMTDTTSPQVHKHVRGPSPTSESQAAKTESIPAEADTSAPTQFAQESVLKEDVKQRTDDLLQSAVLPPVSVSGDTAAATAERIADVSSREGDTTGAGDKLSVAPSSESHNTQNDQFAAASITDVPQQPPTGAPTNQTNNSSAGDASHHDPVGSSTSGNKDTLPDDPIDTEIESIEADTEAYIDDLLRAAAEQGEDMLALDSPVDISDLDPVAEKSEPGQASADSVISTNATPATHELLPMNEIESGDAQTTEARANELTPLEVDDRHNEAFVSSPPATVDATPTVLIQPDLVSITEDRQSDAEFDTQLVKDDQAAPPSQGIKDTADADSPTPSLGGDRSADPQSLTLSELKESTQDMRAEQLSDGHSTSVCASVLEPIVDLLESIEGQRSTS